jgi:CRISPR-associated protein Cas2
MLYISYDISDNKVRTHFHKFLRKYGRPLQYSVFEIQNSQRILSIILLQIDKKFKPRFTNADSIIIVPVSTSDQHKIILLGGLVQEEKEVLWIE